MLLNRAWNQRVGKKSIWNISHNQRTGTSGDVNILRYLTTASKKQRLDLLAKIQNEKGEIQCTWTDGFHAKFHKKWLRDHCVCRVCFHQETKQRQVDTFSIPLSPEIQVLDILSSGKKMSIQWAHDIRDNTCKKSEFDASWLRLNAYSNNSELSKFNPSYPPSIKDSSIVPEGKIPWNGKKIYVYRHILSRIS